MDREDLKKMTQEMAKSINWRRPEDRKQMFDIVQDAALELLEVEDFTTDLLVTKQGDEFNTTIEEHIYLQEDLDSWEPGTALEASTFGSKSYMFTPGPYRRVRVRIPKKRLDEGKYTTADIANAIKDAIIANKISRMFAAFYAAIPGSQVVPTGAITVTALSTAIEKIEDFVPGDLVLVARKSLLRDLYTSVGLDGTSGFSNETKRELEQYGYIDRMVGAFIKPLSDIIPFGTMSSIIPSEDAYLLPRKDPHHIYVEYAEPSWEEWYDYETRTWNISVVFNDAIVINSDIYDRIHAVRIHIT